MTGASVLAALVAACEAPAEDPRLLRAATVAELSADLDEPFVGSYLARLADVGLVARSKPVRIVAGNIVEIRRPIQVYTPTDRGRAIAALPRPRGLDPAERAALA